MLITKQQEKDLQEAADALKPHLQFALDIICKIEKILSGLPWYKRIPLGWKLNPWLDQARANNTAFMTFCRYPVWYLRKVMKANDLEDVGTAMLGLDTVIRLNHIQICEVWEHINEVSK